MRAKIADKTKTATNWTRIKVGNDDISRNQYFSKAKDKYFDHNEASQFGVV